MPVFPVRHAKYTYFDEESRTRHLVSAAHADMLHVTQRAFEILSVVAGMQLANTQRRALLPTVVELLSDPSLAAIGSGPQSQADVLGACIGLAMFAIEFAPSRWTFTHIPAGRVKSPDLYATGPNGETWFVELKTVAPSDSAVIVGGDLDTCSRIGAQRSAALLQLRSPTVPTGPAPAIRVTVPPTLPIATDGRAFVITALPRAGLASRADISAPSVRGCPRDRGGRYLRCTEQCLDGSFHPPYVTAPVVVWGSEESLAVPGGPAPRALLGAIRTINGALWAGSAPLANAAMQRLADTLSEANAEQRAAFAPSVRGLLRATRLHTDQRTRGLLVHGLGTAAQIHDHRTWESEVRRGISALPQARHVNAEELRVPFGESGVEHVACGLKGATVWGTRTRFGIRLAPDLAEGSAPDRHGLPSEGYFDEVLPRGVLLKAETVSLGRRLVHDERINHPRPLEVEGPVVVGHSFAAGASADAASGLTSSQGHVEVRFGEPST